jgi:hypothetical protein
MAFSALNKQIVHQSNLMQSLAKWVGCAIFAGAMVHGRADVVVSEFMADNATTIADEDGDFSDWIELFNNGESPVSLAGWYLTDTRQNLTQWETPAVTLQPGEFLLVFASGKDRAQVGSELHTNFRLDAGGEYLGLIRSDGTSVAWEADFPEQREDISYGLAQDVNIESYLAPNIRARYRVPEAQDAGLGWVAPGFSDAQWALGQGGFGFQSRIPGFQVRMVESLVPLISLSAATTVLQNPSLQGRALTVSSGNINFVGASTGGNYDSNSPFPGDSSVSDDREDFILEITGIITIPQPGFWTFGVNSDDGFSLEIGDFSVSFPNPRGPSDTLQQFQFNQAGDYPLRLVYYERGGGACLELFAASGALAEAGWNGNDFFLVGDENPLGLSVSSEPVAGLAALNNGAAGGVAGSGFSSWIGTDVGSQMEGFNSSLYARFPFEVNDLQELKSLTLRMRYNDGFVAYINGQEVARSNAPDPAVWDSVATATRSAGVSSLPQDFALDISQAGLVQGSNILAVHGLNRLVDDGDFLLSAELLEFETQNLNPSFFAQPTPGSANSEGIISFLSKPRFSQERGFMDQAFDLTLSNDNPAATIIYRLDGKEPRLGFGTVYEGPIRIEKTTVIRAVAVLDGYQPSPVVTHTYLFLEDVIQQSPNGQAPEFFPTSWGANTVDYGMDPEVVNSRFYSGEIIDSLKSLPSFSVVMDLDDMFGASRGFYANPGQDGRDWERPTSMELIYPDGADGFQINCGIRMRGGFSRSTSNPKHALRFFFRGEYGEGKLRYPLFGDRGVDEFDNIDLRTFQNYSWSFQGDNRGFFLRDQFNRDMQLAMGQPTTRGEFYHLYINGQYWGIYNSQERAEASYSESYFGGNKEDYDVVKVEAGPYTVNATDGNMDAWRRLFNFSQQGFSSNAAYFQVQGRNPDGSLNPDYENLVDVDNVIDYMLIIYYGGNLDAPISNFLGNTRPNNFYGIRSRVGTEGFKFFVHDAEHTFLNVNENRTGPFPAGNQFQYFNPQYLFQQLTANPEFRMVVADRIHKYFYNDGLMTPKSLLERFQVRAAEIESAVVAESARWGDSKRATPFTRDTDWRQAINFVTGSYIPRRSAILLGQFEQKGWYPNVDAPTFNQHGGAVDEGFQLSMMAPAGSVYYTTDGSDPRALGGALSGSARIYTGPLALSESQSIKSRTRSGNVWSALNEADFVIRQDFGTESLILSEIMYHPISEGDLDGDDYEFLELKNVSGSTLDLSGMQWTDGIEYTFPNGSRMEPGEFFVLVRNADAFRTRYPNVTIQGVYTGALNNAGEVLQLNHADGGVVFTMEYMDDAPWPSGADGLGFSLVPVIPDANLNPENASSWKPSSSLGGSPGSDDVGNVNLPKVYVNEVLAHTDAPAVDAVELFNPNDTPADISGWYLTDDPGQPKKFRIPAGTIIPANGFVVFSEADFNSNPTAEESFSFSSVGDEAYLHSASAAGDLTGFRHGFSFGATATGVSLGRYLTTLGEEKFPPQQSVTLGSANAGPLVGPVIINEIQYAPRPGDEEFVELKNITSVPVPLFDPENPANVWDLEGIGFEIPTGLTLPPNGLLILVGSDPALFRAKYQIPNEVPVLGPFLGSLQDGGERLKLARPDNPQELADGSSIIPMITVDEVRYDNASPWPTSAFLQGPSLERISLSSFGDDPASWRAAFDQPSPGRNNDGNRSPIVDAGSNVDLIGSLFPLALNLAGEATDDGLPEDPSFLSVEWVQVSGVGAVRFDSPNSASTQVWFPSVGEYILRLQANDGELTAADEIRVFISRPSEEQTILSAGSEWKYLDDGSNQGTNWRSISFDDSSWESGDAQLGYGDGDEVTVVGFGPNSGSKFITTYFRRTLEVSDPESVVALSLGLVRDDGAVVYLNGTEIFRSSMPEGDINFDTFAANVAGGADESNFWPADIDPGLLVDGDNVLAVEIHQANASSSDISFDFELNGSFTQSNRAPTLELGETVSWNLADGALRLIPDYSDDALPVDPGFLQAKWTQLDGPDSVIFGNPDMPWTDVLFPLFGVYSLSLELTDGEFVVTDTLTVEVFGGVNPFDPWRRGFFTDEELLDPAISGENADPDQDGATNFEEFIAGTSPVDSASVLKLDIIIQSEPGQPVQWALTFVIPSDKFYSLERRSSLGVDSDWELVENFFGSDSERLVSHPIAASSSPEAYYYRLRIEVAVE